jgi:hypothetical protein
MWLHKLIYKNTSIYPLAVFRILLGALLLFSTVRFLSNGWVYDLYIQPTFFFTYYGFDWVTPLSEFGMYVVFILMIIAAIGILLGYFYRFSIISFFILFTYVELLDKTNYLNHYYFVSLITFVMCFLPANRYASLDVYFGRVSGLKEVQAWTINWIKFQLGIVYFFAGIAKLNYHWLFEAQPLSNWLKHQTHLPLIGELLKYDTTAFVFSWVGALYDLIIPFVLLSKKWRPCGYLAVIGFHVITWLMFPIGVFPWVMIFCTLIFFDSSFHKKILQFIPFGKQVGTNMHKGMNKIARFCLFLFISIQLLLPFRYLLYPGKLFWTEQGFRFSWRVMLIEKVGYARFFIHEEGLGKFEIDNRKYLTPQQEKMMSTQPDMILQFAHFLKEEFSDTTIVEHGKSYYLCCPKILADVQVDLFNTGIHQMVEPTFDLSEMNRGFTHKYWIKSFEE